VKDVKVVDSLVTQHLRQYKQSTHGGRIERAQRLETYFQVQSARNTIKLSHCDICDGLSDSTLSACPYCGDAAPVEGHAQPGEITVRPAASLSPLDQVLDELKACARTCLLNLYRTGELLKRIRDQQLWKQRRNDQGRPVYRGYLDFVAAEVGFQAAYATRLIRIVENFSQEDLEQYGVSRLNVAASLPADERQAFVEETRSLPTKDLPAAARRRTGMEEFPEMTGKTIMCKLPIGRVLARLYARPTPRSRVGVPEEPAKSLQQRPFTMVRLPNDLWLRIDIKRAPDQSGDLVAGVQLRQGKPIDQEGRTEDADG
jgi:hypothetical protein